jgi:hypothetical protein
MAMVVKNLDRNYRATENSKDLVFCRNAGTFSPNKFDIEITKSTGFTKNSLSKANAQLTSLTSSFIKRPPIEFTDILGNYYTTRQGSKDALPKLEVVKATKLFDVNKSASLDEIQASAGKVLLQHLDSTKYYRIKSGLFGSRDTLSMRKDFNKKKSKTKSQLVSSKTMLTSFIAENTFKKGTPLDFVTNPEYYQFTYEGAILSKENNLIYVLLFKPKKSKANYTGKIYVSENDYAVVRTDYSLAKGKTTGGFNMKLLLGVKTSENLSSGTLIFKQNSGDEGYYLQYASGETGQYIYVNRPLKFIEISDEENDVVAFDLKIEAVTNNKTEYLNISRNEISDAAIAEVSEKDFSYQNLKRYDPNIWKDYSSIEPLEEMKQFRVVD